MWLHFSFDFFNFIPTAASLLEISFIQQQSTLSCTCVCQSCQTGFALETLKIYIVCPNQGGSSNISAISELENMQHSMLSKRKHKARSTCQWGFDAKTMNAHRVHTALWLQDRANPNTWRAGPLISCATHHMSHWQMIYSYMLSSFRSSYSAGDISEFVAPAGCWWVLSYRFVILQTVTCRKAGQLTGAVVAHWIFHSSPQTSLWASWLVWDITAGSLPPCSCSSAKLPLY